MRAARCSWTAAVVKYKHTSSAGPEVCNLLWHCSGLRPLRTVQDNTWSHTERALEMLDSMSAWLLRYGEEAAAGGSTVAAALPADPAPGLLTGGLPDVRSEPAETQARDASGPNSNHKQEGWVTCS